MKVLVTGANSLLGTNIIVELLNRNYTVRGMVRAKGKLFITHARLEEYLGDITDGAAVLEAASGCDIVFHVAANTSQHSLRYKDYADVNVSGSMHVLEAAKKAAVKRVIFISSANAFAYGTKEIPGTEQGEICYPFDRACYARSKYEAQKRVLRFSGGGDPEVVVVNPTFMIGKYDSKPSSGAIVLRGYKKKLILVPPGGKNFIHVKDVAAAACNAIYDGQPGSCYLLANKNMSYKAFYRELVKVTGQYSRIVVLPKSMLLVTGCIGNVLARLGFSTPLHYINMRILCVKNYYSSEKARAELGLQQTPVSEAISDAITWFGENGMLKQGNHVQK